MNEFVAGASQVGAGIGGFLNPIIGGTTKTTVTETPTETSSNKNVIIAIVVVVVVVVGYFLLKPKKG